MFFAVTSGFAIRLQMKVSVTVTLTPLKPSVNVTLTPLKPSVNVTLTPLKPSVNVTLTLLKFQVMTSEHGAEIQMKSFETASIFPGSVILFAIQLFVTWHHEVIFQFHYNTHSVNEHRNIISTVICIRLFIIL